MKYRNYLLSMDILGFKNLTKELSLEELNFHVAKLFTGTSFSRQITGADCIKFLGYADTCILYSTSKNPSQSLTSMILSAHMVQYGQLYKAIGNGKVLIPVRGAIAFGDFIHQSGGISTQASGRPEINADNVQYIVGKPLIEAYEIDSQMELMTVALCDSVIQNTDSSVITNLIAQNLIIEYPVPMKNNIVEKKYIVNPLENIHVDIIVDRLNDELVKVSEIVKPKYHNTLKLINYIKDKNLFYPPLLLCPPLVQVTGPRMRQEISCPKA